MTKANQWFSNALCAIIFVGLITAGVVGGAAWERAHNEQHNALVRDAARQTFEQARLTYLQALVLFGAVRDATALPTPQPDDQVDHDDQPDWRPVDPGRKIDL